MFPPNFTPIPRFPNMNAIQHDRNKAAAADYSLSEDWTNDKRNMNIEFYPGLMNEWMNGRHTCLLTSGWNLRAKPRYARLISFSVAVDDTPRVSYKDSWAAARTPSLFLFFLLSIRHFLPKDCPPSPPILLAKTTTPTRLLFKPSSFPHLCMQRPTHKISLAKSAIPACVLRPTSSPDALRPELHAWRYSNVPNDPKLWGGTDKWEFSCVGGQLLQSLWAPRENYSKRFQVSNTMRI